MQDFTKDLTILVTGTGKTTLANLQSLLEDYIFGPPAKPGEEEISRDVRILIPKFEDLGPGINTLTRWGKPMGMEIEYISGDDDRDALGNALSILTDEFKAGKETAFIMLYNPDSTYVKDDPSISDREIIGEAKNYNWLTTFNLSEGLIDFFEGYESTDDMIKREALQEAYAEQQKAKEEAEPPKKVAVKKATMPRKRASSKAVVAEDKPLTEEPEKPVQPLTDANFATMDKALGLEPEKSGLDKLVEKAYQREADKKAKQNELSATIVMSKPKLEPVPVEVWQDIAKAVPSSTTVTVKKEDLALLGNSIKDMAVAFSDAMKVFTQILEDN
jgi:hypothetical protein